MTHEELELLFSQIVKRMERAAPREEVSFLVMKGYTSKSYQQMLLKYLFSNASTKFKRWQVGINSCGDKVIVKYGILAEGLKLKDQSHAIVLKEAPKPIDLPYPAVEPVPVSTPTVKTRKEYHRLTDEQRAKILSYPLDVTNTSLAREFDITAATVANIRKEGLKLVGKENEPFVKMSSENKDGKDIPHVPAFTIHEPISCMVSIKQEIPLAEARLIGQDLYTDTLAKVRADLEKTARDIEKEKNILAVMEDRRKNLMDLRDSLEKLIDVK